MKKTISIFVAGVCCVALSSCEWNENTSSEKGEKAINSAVVCESHNKVSSMDYVYGSQDDFIIVCKDGTVHYKDN